MARNRKVKGKKYNFERAFKKIVKNPYKRQNAGVIFEIKGNEVQHPPMIVDISQDGVKYKDMDIPLDHFRATKMKYSGLPMIFINGNDIMTSPGIYYNELSPGNGDLVPPRKIMLETCSYKVRDKNNQEQTLTLKDPIPYLRPLQPSHTVSPSALKGMVYSLTKVDSIKDWLKKNQNLMFIMLGIGAGVAISLFLLYNLYSTNIPAIENGVKACAEIARNLQPVGETVNLG